MSVYRFISYYQILSSFFPKKTSLSNLVRPAHSNPPDGVLDDGLEVLGVSEADDEQGFESGGQRLALGPLELQLQQRQHQPRLAGSKFTWRRSGVVSYVRACLVRLPFTACPSVVPYTSFPAPLPH